MNEEEIFQAAAEMPAAERAAYLATCCEGQAALRQRVERLLASHDHDAFMQRPADRADSAELQAELARLKPEAGEDRIGNFKLLQKLGEGGFGTVWMAEQLEPVRRRVALKIIKPGMDSKEVLVRFEQERQALALMDHPNIAKVFDAGVTPLGRPFFVMELVRGIRITDFCDQNSLPTADRLDLFIAVCNAIQHAHQKSIIHRDIKPSNILVTLHDGVPVPKVIDFGVAKAIQSQRLTDLTFFTRFEQMIGTPLYMSPEQAEMSGLDIDTRSDIYSLGVLLYELLTGTTPFDGKELMALGIDAMRKTIRETEPVRPSTRLRQTLVAADVRRLSSKSDIRNPKSEIDGASSRRLLRIEETIALLRGDLDWIVMKCLEKDRTRRYATANGLAADLKRHLKNEPVIARPPSAAYKLQKAWRRNKLAFTAFGFVLAALVIGLATTSWQWRRAERERITGQRQLYVATMNVVQAAWEQSQASLAKQLLEKTATAPERGFEWYYWQRLMHQELKALRGHTGPILAVAYSPDGRQIATGSADRTAKVWDAASVTELRTLSGHTAPIRSVAFFPDGQRFVSGSWDKTARVWDVTTGKWHILEGHRKAIFSVAVSTNGQRIATGSLDHTARVWDAATGNSLEFTNHTQGVWAVAFSPDGLRVVSGSWDKTARVWNANSGKELALAIQNDAVFSVAFSPDGQSIVTGSKDGTVQLWDAWSGAHQQTFDGHERPVFSVSFSPDGRRIISGSDDETARVWDIATGKSLWVLKGHGSRIGSVAYSPDGQRIITGGGGVRFSPDGEDIDVTVGDNAAKVWDATESGEMFTLKANGAPVVSVDFSPNGKLIASGSTDGAVRVWDLGSGQELWVRTNNAAVRSVAFFPDGRRMVTGSRDQTATVWEVDSGKEVFRLNGHTDRLFSVAVSSDGHWIATGSWDNTVGLWDGASYRSFSPFRGHSEAVNPVAFSRNSRRIISGSRDGVAKVWDVESRVEIFPLTEQHGPIWAATFSHNDRRIVTGSHGLTATVWDATTGEKQMTLSGHTAHIHAAVFSPDDSRILTGSADYTAKLWDSTTGGELLTFRGHKGWVFSAAFSPDGQRIVTGSADGTIKVWEAATEGQVARWQKEERTATAMKRAPANPR
jgi:eukaryotic-like serine/threonine-protein kinase